MVSLPVLAILATARVAAAFCGFYVAGADTRLYNNATTVVMMREGTRTVLSMQNNYQGPASNFAMVIPVPVVLKEDNVKTLPRDIFDRVDRLAAPRLVEYWEQDPCSAPRKPEVMGFASIGKGAGSGYGGGGAFDGEVVVEAEFSVGEYDIVILSASDALALESWLSSNGYKIPAGAAPYLRPYIERGEKFFVAKVDVSKVNYKDGMAELSPLRVHYDSEAFALPIRLGLINARDAQDLIVHILARQQRYQVANYKNVTIPTNLSVKDEVRQRFGEFYAALLDATLDKNPGAVVTEYAWDSGTCDPCPNSPLGPKELYTLGLDVLDQGQHTSASPVSARVRLGPVKVRGALDQNIVRRYLRRATPRLRLCHQQALSKDRSYLGSVTLGFTIDQNGAVQKERVIKAPAGTGRSVFAACTETLLKNLRFPKPKGGGVNLVEADVQLTVGMRGTRGFVLTRMHARYTPNNLGEDLIFAVAEPIRGGQGGGMPTEKAAQPAGANTFQGRYIIHHPWTGPIECESPVRGMWGGPPAGVDSATAVARDLAFVARGRTPLGAMLAEPVAAIGASALPAPATPNKQDDKPAVPVSSQEPEKSTEQSAGQIKKRSRGCSASDARLGDSASWWLVWLLVWLLVWPGRRWAWRARL